MSLFLQTVTCKPCLHRHAAASHQWIMGASWPPCPCCPAAACVCAAPACAPPPVPSHALCSACPSHAPPSGWQPPSCCIGMAATALASAASAVARHWAVRAAAWAATGGWGWACRAATASWTCGRAGDDDTRRHSQVIVQQPPPTRTLLAASSLRLTASSCSACRMCCAPVASASPAPSPPQATSAPLPLPHAEDAAARRPVAQCVKRAMAAASGSPAHTHTRRQ